MTFNDPFRQLCIPLLWVIFAGITIILTAYYISWQATLIMFGLWWSENLIKRYCA